MSQSQALVKRSLGVTRKELGSAASREIPELSRHLSKIHPDLKLQMFLVFLMSLVDEMACTA